MILPVVNAHEGILASDGMELHSVTSTILTRKNTGQMCLFSMAQKNDGAPCDVAKLYRWTVSVTGSSSGCKMHIARSHFPQCNSVRKGGGAAIPMGTHRADVQHFHLSWTGHPG